MIKEGKRMINCTESELQEAAKFDKNTMSIYRSLMNAKNSSDEDERMIVEEGLFDPIWDGTHWEGAWN